MKNQFKYFNQCNNLQDVKSTFRTLAKKHHPDMGGDAELFKIINNEYELAWEYFKKLDNDKETDTKKHSHESSEAYKNIIEKLIKLDGLTIEIIGSWIWISGNTYLNRETIKSLNCRYSKPKNNWYWFEGIEGTVRQKGHYTKNQLINKFEYTKIESEGQPKLQ